MNVKERVQRIRDEATGSDLSSWEKFEFLPTLEKRHGPLTPKQEVTLRNLEKRLNITEEE